MRSSLVLALILLLSLACASTLPNFRNVYEAAESLSRLKIEGIESESELVPLVNALEAETAAARGKANSDREAEFVREAESLLEIYKDGLLVSSRSTELLINGEKIEVVPATQETKMVFAKYGVNPKDVNGTELFDGTSTSSIWLAALRQWGRLQNVYKGE